MRWRVFRTKRKLVISNGGRWLTVPPGALILASRVRDAENNALGGAVSRRPRFNITSFRFITKARDAEQVAPWSNDQGTRTSMCRECGAHAALEADGHR